jgi:ABC-type glycerol-3-phosphate transport system substrate-binding protein
MSDKQSLTRRKFLKVAAFGGAATALAACAQATPQIVEVTKVVTVKETSVVQQTVQVEVTKEVEKQVQVEVTKEVVKEVAVTAVPEDVSGELIFWGHADHPIYDAGQAFMAKYQNVKFTHVEMADWGTKLEASLAAGSGAPDLIWLEATTTQLYARRNVLIETTELIKKYEDVLLPAKLNEIRYQGKYWGMCGDVTPCLLWYRPDIMEKGGVTSIDPDIKYDAFLQASKDIKAKADASMYIMESTFDGQGMLMYMVPFYSLGANVSDENSDNIAVDSDAGVEAMNQAKMAWDTQAGLDAGWMQPPYWAAVKEGKLAGTYSPPWMRGFFQTTVITPEEGQGMWRNMVTPVYAGGTARGNVWGGASLCSTTQSADKASLVTKFMEYAFCTMEGATVTGNWGIVPPYKPYLAGGTFKMAKQSLFDPTWDWTGAITKAIDNLRPDFNRSVAYGIWSGNLAKFALPIFKGEKPIKDGVKEFSDFVRSENQKQLDAI